MKKYFRAITAENLGKSWDYDTCDFVYELMLEAIKRAIVEHGKLNLRGLFNIEIKNVPTKKNYNFITKSFIECPAHNGIKIKALDELKDAINEDERVYVKKKKGE